MTDIVLTADRVLRGPAGQHFTPGAVLVRDGVIAAIGTTTELEQRTGADLDARHYPGATILPGLIDGHVHLSLDAGTDQPEVLDRFARRGDELLLEDMHTRAAAAGRVGVTTLRDVGDRHGLVARLRDADAGTHRLPRLLTAGAPLTVPGGDSSAFGGAVASGALAEAVREHAAAGVDFISLMTSGGFLGPDGAPAPHESQYGREDIATVVGAAHDLGLPVTAHAHATQAIADAAAAGVDVIEHATFVTGPHEITLDEKAIEQMAEHAIAVCVTASLNWRRVAAQMGNDRARDLFYGRIQRFYAAGVPQLPGSRAGTANAPFGDLVSTLEAYEWAGVPRDVVLDYATCGAAHALGIATTTGTLTEGLSADILVVDGDPRADLGALRHVQAVMQHGHWR